MSIAIGILLGFLLGGFLSKNFIPPWFKTKIYADLSNIERILYVSYLDTINEEIFRDTIILETGNGDIYKLNNYKITLLDPIPEDIKKFEIKVLRYSEDHAIAITDYEKMYILHGNNWIQRNQIEEIQEFREFPPCNEWNVKPPIGKKYKDTNGVFFERPLSTTYRWSPALLGAINITIEHMKKVKSTQYHT